MRSNLLQTIIIVLASQSLAAQENFFDLLSKAAVEITDDRVVYDPSYFRISYPSGDVPADRGACTDVVILAYRKLGIDLQREVHEDMKANFDAYPGNWGLRKPDPNIDHRRVPNLMTFFSRNGKVLKVSASDADYSPGDIVTWDLGRGLTHIGIVVDKKSAESDRFLIVHNVGNGQEIWRLPVQIPDNRALPL
jgi:uncharacterized protein